MTQGSSTFTKPILVSALPSWLDSVTAPNGVIAGRGEIVAPGPKAARHFPQRQGHPPHTAVSWSLSAQC